MQITLAQLEVPDGDPDRAWLLIEQALADTKGKSDLVVFPELATTGYNKIKIIEESKTLEEAAYRLSRLAIAHQVNALVSLPVLEGENRHNTAILVNKTGSIVSYYHKRHLFAPLGERDLFIEGREIKLAKLGNWKIGLSICYDLRFPIEYRIMTRKGAHVLVTIAEWPLARINHWRALLIARAIENQTWVVGVNRVGADREVRYGGHSMVVAPNGEVKVELGEQEELSTFYLSMDAIAQARHLFDVTEDERMEIGN